MMNTVHDYVNAWQGWVGRDEVSKMKFAMDVRDQFGMPLEEAVAIVNQYVRYPPARQTFDVLARRFCERQAMTPHGLLTLLKSQRAIRPDATGWLLCQFENMDSHLFSHMRIVCYGPGCEVTEIPANGLLQLAESAAAFASVIGIFMVEDLPDAVPESLSDWTEPLTPVKPKRGRPKKVKS